MGKKKYITLYLIPNNISYFRLPNYLSRLGQGQEVWNLYAFNGSG